MTDHFPDATKMVPTSLSRAATMSSPFIAIHSTGGRIGRFCWVNSDTQHPRCYGYVIEAGRLRGWITGGWWGSTYLCSPHPATPGEAW
jgi:hypothetical protein